MSGVVRSVGRIFGFGRSRPSYGGGYDGAAEAKKQMEEQRKQQAAYEKRMQAQLDAIRKTSDAYQAPRPTGATSGDAMQGLSGVSRRKKEERRMRTRDTRIQLDPAGAAGGVAGSGMANIG